MENVMDKLKQMVTAEYKAFEKEMSEKHAWEVFDRSFEIEYFKNCYNYIISQIGYEWTEEYLGDKDIAFFEKLMEKYLTNSEQAVLKYRFGFMNGNTMTLNETANILSKSIERVRKIEQSAIKKLRQPYLKAKLKDYAI